MTDRTPADVTADLRVIADEMVIPGASRSPFADRLRDAAALIDDQAAKIERWKAAAVAAHDDNAPLLQAEQLRHEVERLTAENADLLATLTELAPSDEVVVQGSVFQRDELPGVLDRVMTSRDESQREAKRYFISFDQARTTLAKVRTYADDRAFHARGHLNTVNSGRIASDLLAILDAAPTTEGTNHE